MASNGRIGSSPIRGTSFKNPCQFIGRGFLFLPWPPILMWAGRVWAAATRDDSHKHATHTRRSAGCTERRARHDHGAERLAAVPRLPARGGAGRLAEAEATLRRAYELEPGNPMIAVNYAEALYLRGDYERARFYVRRVNQSEATSNAQTLWLAARIEMKLGNQQGANDFGLKLRNRFPKSRESLAFDRGAFNE